MTQSVWIWSLLLGIKTTCQLGPLLLGLKQVRLHSNLPYNLGSAVYSMFTSDYNFLTVSHKFPVWNFQVCYESICTQYIKWSNAR